MKILIEKYDAYGYDKFKTVWKIGYLDQTGNLAMMFEDGYNILKIYLR